uniref:Large ribosomal subunit protein bL35m n=2 Tax=Timema TaxID=61471 RepID=A0A7R9IBG0_9NEOP|nr:unnamed protein product [Timema bartmani]CAD7454993.1 unnamed protein product [Timema tahoe]
MEEDFLEEGISSSNEELPEEIDPKALDSRLEMYYAVYYDVSWGGWIRTRSGRHKKLWKKKENLRRRLRQHVFCNATQSWLLDKMVTKYWRQPRYYVDDPYEPYHTREEFLVTRKKPLP